MRPFHVKTQNLQRGRFLKRSGNMFNMPYTVFTSRFKHSKHRLFSNLVFLLNSNCTLIYCDLLKLDCFIRRTRGHVGLVPMSSNPIFGVRCDNLCMKKHVKRE